MKLEGPQRYAIDLDANTYHVTDGVRTFAGLGSRRGPKLYLIVHDDLPVYVGITRQRLSTRFGLGWRANGANGYYGYRFRHTLTKASVDVWCLGEAGLEKRAADLDIETIEAEVVFAIRGITGQWPEFQTEIHFHPSGDWHRAEAARVLSGYAKIRAAGVGAGVGHDALDASASAASIAGGA